LSKYSSLIYSSTTRAPALESPRRKAKKPLSPKLHGFLCEVSRQKSPQWFLSMEISEEKIMINTSVSSQHQTMLSNPQFPMRSMYPNP